MFCHINPTWIHTKLTYIIKCLVWLWNSADQILSRFCLSIYLFNLAFLQSIHLSFLPSIHPYSHPFFGPMLCWLFLYAFFICWKLFQGNFLWVLKFSLLEKYLVICVSPLKITLALFGSCAWVTWPITVSGRIGLSKYFVWAGNP